MKQEEKKSKGNLGTIILLIGLILIAFGVAIITFFPTTETPETSNQNEENQEVEQPETSNQNEEIQETEQQVSNAKSIELTKETEELVVDDNLKIKFIGTKDPTMEETAYQYKAEIYLNNELITDNFFTGTNIYSTNYGATFDVTKIENTYIIKSFIAKQCNGSFVLALSTDKTFTSYNDVSIEINEELKQYTISKCNDCMDTTSCANETVNIPKLTK